MAEFNWISGLTGGLLIGLSATVLLAFNGQIAGISGILSGGLGGVSDALWRRLFIAGMLLGGGIYEYLLAPAPTPASEFSPLGDGGGRFACWVRHSLGQWLHQRARRLWTGSAVGSVFDSRCHLPKRSDGNRTSYQAYISWRVAIKRDLPEKEFY